MRRRFHLIFSYGIRSTPQRLIHQQRAKQTAQRCIYDILLIGRPGGDLLLKTETSNKEMFALFTVIR